MALRAGKRQSVIADPMDDAGKKYGLPFEEVRRVNPWERWMSHATTGQFASLKGGFVRHCGPTAITNIITTLNKRYHYLVKESGQRREPAPSGYFPSQAEIFEKVSELGIRKRFYWNMDVLKRFGGTYDLLTGFYLKNCFRYYGIPYRMSLSGIQGKNRLPRDRWQASKPEVVVKSVIPVRKEQYLRSLRRGNLLYLQLHHHPCYGSHHLVCYGYVEVAARGGICDGQENCRKTYLIVADGWTHALRYLDTSGIGLCRYYEIGVSGERSETFFLA
uniref:hypothetical protein n=1 Tax=Eubacterium cellulosolvens TaxID=29322 RepID=UPI0004866B2B|nr:hypothetical protein [[Eubacterium] cellulosolvens]